jgi:hypothetical protein
MDESLNWTNTRDAEIGFVPDLEMLHSVRYISTDHRMAILMCANARER